jgi:hypothetical protein
MLVRIAPKKSWSRQDFFVDNPDFHKPSSEWVGPWCREGDFLESVSRR